jgi:hypothetical protein
MGEIEEDAAAAVVVNNNLGFEDVAESRNRILPRALEGGIGIPVILSKLPVLEEIETKTGDIMNVLRFEFYEQERNAYADVNCILPKTFKPDEIVSENDKNLQRGSLERMKHLLTAFISTEGLAGSNYKDIVKSAITRFTSEMVGTPCQIKLVYNKAGIISFPTVGDCISTKKQLKNLSWNPKYDNATPKQSGEGGGLSTEVDAAKMASMM